MIYYTLSHRAVRRPYPGQGIFKNGPGGTARGEKTGSTTITWDVRVGAEAEAGVVLAKAKTSISAGLAKAQTSTFTYSYERAITPGRYGNIQYMNWSERVSYTKYRTNSNCSRSTLGSGVIDYPSTTEGFYYWETSS